MNTFVSHTGLIMIIKVCFSDAQLTMTNCHKGTRGDQNMQAYCRNKDVLRKCLKQFRERDVSLSASDKVFQEARPEIEIAEAHGIRFVTHSSQV